MKTRPAHSGHFPNKDELLNAPSQPLSQLPHQTKTTCHRTVESRDLLGDQVMVQIRHFGEIYRLQSTRLGKLILTK